MPHKRNQVFWKEDALSVPASLEELPLAIKKRKPEGELSIKEIRAMVDNHSLSKEELESIVKTLLMRISCYLDNRFVCY